MKPLKIAARVVSWYEGILGILAGLYILVSGIDLFYFWSDGTASTRHINYAGWSWALWAIFSLVRIVILIVLTDRKNNKAIAILDMLFCSIPGGIFALYSLKEEDPIPSIESAHQKIAKLEGRVANIQALLEASAAEAKEKEEPKQIKPTDAIDMPEPLEEENKAKKISDSSQDEHLVSEEESEKELEHLEALFAMGAISNKEFAREKTKILLQMEKDD